MYKYSKKSEERYFQSETESFMLAVFSLSDEGILFLKEKPDNCKDQEKLNRILKDLASLKDQALLSLELMSQGKILRTTVDPSDCHQEGLSEKENEGPSEQSEAPSCDLQVGSFLFKQLKKMTRNKLWFFFAVSGVVTATSVSILD